MLARRAPLALALGVALLACGSQAQQYGPMATEVLATCPRSSFYGENFWLGVNLLGVETKDTIGGCCKACDDNTACTKWTYCPTSQAPGCTVPVGPLARRSFPAGACLLSNGRAGDNSTFLSWSYMQPGNPWHAGTWTPEGLEVQVFEDASSYTDDLEGIESREDAFFCRRIAGPPAEIRPVRAAVGTVAPSLSEGMEVIYTGLRLKDEEGVQWAVLFFNDTKTFWLYDAAKLESCEGEHPGCSTGVSGGRTEEGATCEMDTDCCGNLFCKPREVSEVRIIFEDSAGEVRYQPFRLAPGPRGPAVMPNECVRLLNGSQPEPGNGPHFDSPKWKDTPLDFCRSFGVRCGAPAADYFCQLHGYGRAADWSRVKVPVTPPCPNCVATVIPEQASACSTAFFPHCDTFKFIMCGN